MAKASGLGDRLFVDGYNLSGDIQSIKELAGGFESLDVTDITQSAYDRIGGRKDGTLSFVSFFDTTAGASHPVLSALPTADVVISYGHGTTLGNPIASLVAKQTNYDGERSNDGMFVFSVEATANGFGLDWGVQSGIRADTGATNGSSVNTTASKSLGWAMHWHLLAVAGGNIVLKVQDSADNASFSDVSGATSGTLVAIGAGRVVSSSGTATVRQYWRVVSTGTFTTATFVVNFNKHQDVAVTY